MKVIKYSSLAAPEVPPLWRSYFQQPSVMGDYSLACHIERSLWDYGVDDVAVFVFTDDNDTVRGILPISHEKESDFWCYYPSYIFISAKITIDDECWPLLPTMLPRPLMIYELSFRVRTNVPWVAYSQANVINLSFYVDSPNPLHAYIDDLPKKSRYHFRRYLVRNSDLTVEVSGKRDIRGGNALMQEYQQYCMDKFDNTPFMVYFKNQLEIFPKLFETAERLGQLVALGIRSDCGELVALNYSIFEGDCVYDYICYRAPRLERRALGIFAILKNIEYALSRVKCGELYYDLAAEFDYKKQFLTSNSSDYREVKLSLGE